MGFTQGPCEHDLNRIDTLQFGGGLWSNPTFEQWTPMEARKFRKEQHPQHPGEKKGLFLDPSSDTNWTKLAHILLSCWNWCRACAMGLHAFYRVQARNTAHRRPCACVSFNGCGRCLKPIFTMVVTLRSFFCHSMRSCHAKVWRSVFLPQQDVDFYWFCVWRN